MKLEKIDITDILENALTYIVVFAMFAYGVGKYIQFSGEMPLEKTVGEMTGMQLMWAFYGYSRPFVIILGVLEISGGILMLIKKTRLLGCLFITTILVNVILQDIFYDVNVGALRAAIIYQMCIVCILWFNKEKLIQSLRTMTSSPVFSSFNKKYYVKIVMSVFLFIVLRILEYYITTKWY